MNREEILYLVPYILSLLLSFGICLYAWHHRQVRGARVYSLFVGGQTLTILGFILELVSPTLEAKILWDKVQWLTDTFLVILPFLVFAVQYSEQKLDHPVLAWGGLGIFLGAFMVLFFTDHYHHLFYPNPHLSTDYPFPDLEYDFTFVVVFYLLFYVYGATLFGIGLLVKRAFEPHSLYRSQEATMAIGFLIPIALSVFSFLGIRITPQRDISPLTFALGNLVVAYGLFRYRIFDMVPIARERVFEKMPDQVIVLDALDRLVDINQAGLDILQKRSSEVIGQPTEVIFSRWADLVEKFKNVDHATTEITAEVAGEMRIFELEISPIRGSQDHLIGRVFVARDITRQKALQDQYRKLSEELELRVSERTEELRRSAARYQAVVENQTEFIVRWKPDGTRTFVNEAYRRYFGLDSEKSVGESFMPLIVEEDRPLVQEKISRLTSGVVNVETEVHRVIRPDGSIAWQEWTDQAIRDESGRLIEFQSVGRDITERKQAEEKLAEAYDTTLEGWAKALEFRDKETEGHSRRVTEITLKLAEAMGVHEQDMADIYRGAILHDVGKMAVPDEVLRKRGALTDEEWEIVRQHPTRAYELLSPIPYLSKALEIPYCHHEKWDGTGYPRGLKGEQIPLSARIFAIVDVWDALQSDRPYNRAWPKERAIAYIREQAGKYFDPQVVRVFLRLLDEGQL